jgi:subtilisin family serine protease
MQRTTVAEPFLVGYGVDLRVDVTGEGQPLDHAEVSLFLETWGRIRRMLAGETDENGHIAFSYGWFFDPTDLLVIPYANFWRPWIEGPRDPRTVDCLALPMEGPLGWWHHTLRIRDYDLRGSGVRIGVIDSGCGPHPALAHVTRIGAFIDGEHDPESGADSGSHGSHVCGTIAARPVGEGHYGGIASGAELYCARVFPPDGGANQGDIANAIDELSKVHRVDLINMSLGADTGSEIERDAIQDALERGTLCVCAAGNDGKRGIIYPAAFTETIAVSALGRLGEAPAETLSAKRAPEDGDKRRGSLYLANFSSFGPEIDCVAPGVGIIATVPERYSLEAPYAPMDGTSMASPAACGALVVMLSRDNDYHRTPRDQTRAEMARAILHRCCRDLGLPNEYQGYGVPDVS